MPLFVAHRKRNMRFRCEVTFGLKAMLNDLPEISTYFEFSDWNCHKHPPFVFLDAIRGSVRRDIAKETPRKSQITALLNNDYNPFSSRQNDIPSRNAAGNARTEANKGRMDEKLQRLQSKELENDARKVPMIFKGNIHNLILHPNYLCFSLFNRVSVAMYIRFSAHKNPGCCTDSTEKLVARVDGQKMNTYRLIVQNLTNKTFIKVWETFTDSKDAEVFTTTWAKFRCRKVFYFFIFS